MTPAEKNFKRAVFGTAIVVSLIALLFIFVLPPIARKAAENQLAQLSPATSLNQALVYLTDVYGKNGQIEDLEKTLQENGFAFQDWKIEVTTNITCKLVAGTALIPTPLDLTPTMLVTFEAKKRGLFEYVRDPDREWLHNGDWLYNVKTLQDVNLIYWVTARENCTDPQLIISVQKK